MRSIANRFFFLGAITGILLAAGCGKGQGTGLLTLSISPDPINPPSPAIRIVLTDKSGKIDRTYPEPFPLGGDAGSILVLEYPNLPASDSPIALTLQAFAADGCLVGSNAVPLSVTIKAGAETGPIDVKLSKTANVCGDGGIADGNGASIDSGIARVGDADGAGADVAKDAPSPSFAEVGTEYDSGDALHSPPTDIPVLVDVGVDVPMGGGSGGSGVLGDTGGAIGSGGSGEKGGTGGSDGPSGTGGVVASGGAGGATGTGGIVAAGGTSTGGAANGGAIGTGGTTTVCQGSATQCLATTSVQTCTNGQWGTPVACGPHQTCTGSIGSAQCTCNADPVCTSIGKTCASNGTAIVTCSQDDKACFYASSSDNCSNGACTGSAGSALCCTNACTTGATQCQSSTSLQTCSVAASGCMAYSTATCSSGLVCKRLAPAACADPNWAEWPLPNSQVDVSAGAPNLEGYTDNGDGTVTDNITGLMWQQTVPATTYTWADAVAYCPTLSLAGHNDWRLPSLIELYSIVDVGRSSPSINSTYFPSTISLWFWSSSPVAGSSSTAWYVYFSNGYAFNSDVSSPNHVRCVR